MNKIFQLAPVNPQPRLVSLPRKTSQLAFMNTYKNDRLRLFAEEG